MGRTHYSCPVLIALEFSGQIFEKKKSSNINFKENPSSKRRVVPSGQTDGRDEYNKSLSAVLRKRHKTGSKKKTFQNLQI